MSYRRTDTSGFAGRLHDALSDRFGPERVFRDIDSIPLGADFVQVVEDGVASCRALVAVIGNEWLACTDATGRRRLDDPHDFVRLEIGTALQRNILVVPVLVEAASMPAAADLPESLTALARRNALEISDGRWNTDVARLVATLEEAVGPARRGGPDDRRLTPRRAVAGVVSLVTLAASLLGVYLGVRPFLTAHPPPRPMTGAFNIAVAQFRALSPGGSAVRSTAADVVAASFYDQLDSQLVALNDEHLDLKTRAPVATGSVDGSTPAKRADSAKRLSDRINADIVVYGVLQSGPSDTAFSPEFYVSGRKLSDAEELTGQHNLGGSIRVAGSLNNPVVVKLLRDQLLARIQAMTQFIVGLSYYTVPNNALQNHYAPALKHFLAAQAVSGWDDRDGKEVVYLFTGSAEAKTGDLDGARAAYARALTVNPEYARGRLGLAEILFQQAKGACEFGHVDVGGLTAALANYRIALSARFQPELSDILTKVVFAEGRVHLCLSQALVADYWADAEREFQQVITEYRNGNGRVQELAGESYANLGFVHLPATGDLNSPVRYRQAAADYQNAIDVIGDDDRKAFFSSMRGLIFGRLGDLTKADDAYGLAIRLARDPAARARYEQAQRSLSARP